MLLAVKVEPRPRLLRLRQRHAACRSVLSGYGARKSFGGPVAVGQNGFWSERASERAGPPASKRENLSGVLSQPSKFLTVSFLLTSSQSRHFAPESRKKNGREASHAAHGAKATAFNESL